MALTTEVDFSSRGGFFGAFSGDSDIAAESNLNIA